MNRESHAAITKNAWSFQPSLIETAQASSKELSPAEADIASGACPLGPGDYSLIIPSRRKRQAGSYYRYLSNLSSGGIWHKGILMWEPRTNRDLCVMQKMFDPFGSALLGRLRCQVIYHITQSSRAEAISSLLSYPGH